MNLDTIVQQFYNAGLGYSAAIQPYARDLWYGLLFIEFLVTAIQYVADGQLDPWFYAARLFRHLMAGFFCYVMIVNGFAWMMLVLKSFTQIGTAITGLPSISPQGVLQAGLSLANQILNFPATSSIITNLELGIVEAFCVIVILLAFLVVAADLLLLWVRAYLTVGLGTILLAFGANRFTSSMAEGYFTNVIRIGIKLLFFYAVLAIAMQLVNQWQAALLAVCAPVPTTVGLFGSYYVPPSAIETTVCSGSLAIGDLLGYCAYAFIFAVTCVMVPSMAADLVGGSLGLGLMHAFEAAYIAQRLSRPLTSAYNAIHRRRQPQ